jgi:hypothetical protein
VLIPNPLYTPISQILKHLPSIAGCQFIGSVKKRTPRLEESNRWKNTTQQGEPARKPETDFGELQH